jgi:uncharacterized protein (TIGR01777 family)
MNILVTGISGVIGNILTQHWEAGGNRVIGVSRNPKQCQARFTEQTIIVDWGALTPEFFQVRKIDAIVNLCGAPMIQKWNKRTKPEILSSRQNSLEKVYALVRQLPPSRRPGCIINASSVAIYSTQREEVDESIQPDLDINFFQSLVWQKLEKRVRELSVPDVRTVIARIGLLIGPYEMMQIMLSCSRWGAGAVIGNGKQKISWISHHDLARAFDQFLCKPSMSGTYNVVSPEVVTAEEMSTSIAAIYGRQVWLRIPDRGLRILLGELAENFLTSAAVKPARLKAANFTWNLPQFTPAIEQARWEINALPRISPKT